MGLKKFMKAVQALKGLGVAWLLLHCQQGSEIGRGGLPRHALTFTVVKFAMQSSHSEMIQKMCKNLHLEDIEKQIIKRELKLSSAELHLIRHFMVAIQAK